MKEMFIQKLSKMLGSNNPCCAWMEDGKSFVVNGATFSKHSPSNISNKYTSFQRQLNLYNFRRKEVKGIVKPWFVYHNPMFVRDDEISQSKIKRKCNYPRSDIVTMKRKLEEQQDEIDELKKKIAKLSEENKKMECECIFYKYGDGGFFSDLESKLDISFLKNLNNNENSNSILINKITL